MQNSKSQALFVGVGKGNLFPSKVSPFSRETSELLSYLAVLYASIRHECPLAGKLSDAYI